MKIFLLNFRASIVKGLRFVMKKSYVFERIFLIIVVSIPFIFFYCETKESNSPRSINKNIPIEKLKPTETPLSKDIHKSSSGINSKVIAYYFHPTVRCPTCLDIEASARFIIEKDFAAQIDDGKLIWMPFNLDDPGGRELEKEFDISVSTLVLVKLQNGKHREFKKLEKVWELIGDPELFDRYIAAELQQFLEKSFSSKD